jgi:hypothetical protein
MSESLEKEGTSMKKTLLASIALLLPLAASASVVVEWVHPEKFKDAYSNSTKSEKSREAVLVPLEQFITEQVSAKIPADQTFTMSVTTLDIEGEFEPWSQNPDVRILRDTYWARMTFDYKLTDATGKVIKEGKDERIVNKLLTPPSLPDRDEQASYTRDMLRTWIGRNLGK